MGAREGRAMQALPRTYRWSRAEYDRLGAVGFLAGRRVELIGGEIIEMSPKGTPHAVSTERSRRALERLFPRESFTVRVRDPLALGDWDEPEPDVAVVVGPPEAYLPEHPTPRQTLLVIEVADSTVAFDTGHKADIYAAARIGDYWVVDIPAMVV